MVIPSGNWQFYGLVTDLQLGATDPRFADEPSEARLPPALAKALQGQTLYTNLKVLPASCSTADRNQAQPNMRPGGSRKGRMCHARSGQDRPAASHPGQAGPAGGYRRDLRRPVSKGEFRDRHHPRTGPPGLHGSGEVRSTLSGGVRCDRHRQVVPDAHRAGRADYSGVMPRSWSLICIMSMVMMKPPPIPGSASPD